MGGTLPIIFEGVKSPEQTQRVANLAKEIWPEVFTPIIGAAQVAYMLAKFQSAEAIDSQLAERYRYYLARQENTDIGYMAVIPDFDNRNMMLSKLYVKKSSRGCGVGKRMLDIVEQECIDEKLETLWLTVNRLNIDAIAWYERQEFVNEKAMKKDIGAGFFMDDYIMKKQIGI